MKSVRQVRRRECGVGCVDRGWQVQMGECNRIWHGRRLTSGMNTPTPDDPDAVDVQRVLAGDVGAFEGIVRRWQGPIMDLAFRFCRERGLAEEIAQDTFVKVFKSLGTWRQESRFSTWLFAVAVNMSRSRLRRWRPDWHSVDEIEALAAPGRPDTDYEVSESAERIRRTVLDLPRKYREAIILFYFHDMNLAEAARTLGVPEGTLKARLHRGRELLRRKLKLLPDLSFSAGVA